MINPNYTPEKLIFTEADIKDMCLHDCQIHAIATMDDGLALDIDYMFEWFEPKEGELCFAFQIAPCTLFFKNVSDLGIDFDGFPVPDALIIQDFYEEPDKTKFNPAARMFYVNCLGGLFSIFCHGFELIVRQKPVHHSLQVLTPEQRGGISFSRKPYITQ